MWRTGPGNDRAVPAGWLRGWRRSGAPPRRRPENACSDSGRSEPCHQQPAPVMTDPRHVSAIDARLLQRLDGRHALAQVRGDGTPNRHHHRRLRAHAVRGPSGRHPRRPTLCVKWASKACLSIAFPARRSRASSTCSRPMYGCSRRSASRSAIASSLSETRPAPISRRTRREGPLLTVSSSSMTLGTHGSQAHLSKRPSARMVGRSRQRLSRASRSPRHRNGRAIPDELQRDTYSSSRRSQAGGASLARIVAVSSFHSLASRRATTTTSSIWAVRMRICCSRALARSSTRKSSATAAGTRR